MPLSRSQKTLLSGWARAAAVFPTVYNPTSNRPQEIASGVLGGDIICGASGEPGLSASLAAMAYLAEQERINNGRQRLFTENIFPQDDNGNPIYNPSGKYTVKMYVNGMWRAVTVDDFFPVGASNQPLFSHVPSGQLWVSILEKACAKVRGGYPNIGLKPCLDIFALTSWIPQRIPLKGADAEKLWAKLRGDEFVDQKIMILSTGQILKEEEVGLKSYHTYAVFQMFECDGKKMFLIKNTYPKLEWKQRYSYADKASWTETLKRYYTYKDQGPDYFYTDLETIISCFEYIDINWNPQKLAHRQTVWGTLKSEDIINDQFNLLQSPQYVLEFQPDTVYKDVNFYAIVTKMHTVDEPLENGEILTSLLGEDLIGLNAYGNDKYSKVPYTENSWNNLGLSSDTQQTIKLVIPNEAFAYKRYINLVLRTLLRKRSLNYRYYFFNIINSIYLISSCSFKVHKIIEPYKYKITYPLEITAENSGGSARHSTRKCDFAGGRQGARFGYSF